VTAPALVEGAGGPPSDATSIEAVGEEQQRREGGRRRRGRRGRGSGAERAPGAAETGTLFPAAAEAAQVAAPESGARPAETPPTVAIDVDALPAQAPSGATGPIRQAMAPQAPAPQPETLPEASPTAALPAPAGGEPAPKTTVERVAVAAAPELPVGEPLRPRNLPPIPPITFALPSGSELELVQTTVKPAEPEQEIPQEPRPKRVRPPRPVVKEEPLQIVETRRDDAAPPA
jgi:ribonuclease E